MLLEVSITEHVGRAESSGHELPLGIESLKARLDRRAQMAVDDYTSLEGILRQATEAVCRLVVAERACYLCTAR